MNKLAAIVIFYNPEDDVLKNISSYGHDVDTLIIVDNSTECNKELIQIINKEYNLCYINNNDNLGIASALNIGCDKAIELGYRWTLTMDQDSEFLNFKKYRDCLDKHYESNKIALIAAEHLCITSYKQFMLEFFSKSFVTNNAETHLVDIINKLDTSEYEETDFVITSGNILNLSLFNEIGRFEDKLFIDEVDYDYCAKCLIKNYKIIKFENIKFKHELGYYKDGVPQHNYIRKYYIFRNILYMASKYGKIFPEYSYRKVFPMFRKSISHIWRKEEDRNRKIKSVMMAFIDFGRNKYGKKF